MIKTHQWHEPWNSGWLIRIPIMAISWIPQLLGVVVFQTLQVGWLFFPGFLKHLPSLIFLQVFHTFFLPMSWPSTLKPYRTWLFLGGNKKSASWMKSEKLGGESTPKQKPRVHTGNVAVGRCVSFCKGLAGAKCLLLRVSPWKYCWWTKSCTTKDDDYPIIYRVLCISGGAGFRPSTVWHHGSYYLQIIPMEVSQVFLRIDVPSKSHQICRTLGCQQSQMLHVWHICPHLA